MKKLVMIGAVALLAVGLSACGKTSEKANVATDGEASFKQIVNTFKDDLGFHDKLKHWGIKLPGMEKYEWSKDMSANKADMAMVIDAKPFIDAGVDPKKLDMDTWMYNTNKAEVKNEMGVFIHPNNIGDKNKFSSGAADAMRVLLTTKPEIITYDKDAKFYTVDLGKGFQVKWAKKVSASGTQMQFVVNPKTLQDAGLDVNKLTSASEWKLDGSNLVKTYTLTK